MRCSNSRPNLSWAAFLGRALRGTLCVSLELDVLRTSRTGILTDEARAWRGVSKPGIDAAKTRHHEARVYLTAHSSNSSFVTFFAWNCRSPKAFQRIQIEF
jgi:hypothetical protein